MSPEQQLETRRKVPLTVMRSQYPTETATIAVVGLGYVGLPLAILAAHRGFRVIGFDIDEAKIAQLSRRQADFLRPDDAERFARSTSALSITAKEKDLRSADAFIMCVPTPVHENHTPDLRPLETASAMVGRNMRPGSLVVIESTVSPGVCEEIALPIIERVSGLSRREFAFAHCPERVNPGDEHWDVRVIPRVLGALDERALERATKLYEKFVDAHITKMQSIREAEAVKMIENAFRDVNIAFVNELAIAFDRAGIDIVNVIRGATTKPFGFMPFLPGCGVGGHCIPVDPYYLIRLGRTNGFEHQFLITARHINSTMPLYAVDVLERALRKKKKKLAESTVALLGLTYKPDVPDMRESPAIVIRDTLIQKGASVRTYDPYVPSTADTLEGALRGADAALIATDHKELCTLTPDYLEKCGVGVVVDGRNCLDKALFIDSTVLYRGIGR